MRGRKVAAVVAIATVGLTTLASAPAASAKEPKNFDWLNIQVITSTPYCGNSVDASRYNAKGKLLGTRRLIEPTPGIEVIPVEYNWSFQKKPRNFLFQTYDCNSGQTKIYEWNLSDKNSSPNLRYTSSPGETIFDIAYKSKNIVFIRGGDADGDYSVDMLLQSGGITRIWDAQAGISPEWDTQARIWVARDTTGFTPQVLQAHKGRELRIIGTVDSGAWVEIKVQTDHPMKEAFIKRTGPGSIQFSDVGYIDDGDASIYVASETQAWLCNPPWTAEDIQADANCVAFRPVRGGGVADVHIDSGKAKGSDSMDSARLLYWNGGSGSNYVQPVTIDPTGLPQLGSFMQLDEGPAASARHLIPATDLDHAIDAFKVKTWRAG